MALLRSHVLTLEHLTQPLLHGQEWPPRGSVAAKPLQRAPDMQHPAIKIDIRPLQSEHLAPAKATTQRHRYQAVKAMALSRPQQLLRLFRGQRMYLMGDGARRINEHRRVADYEPPTKRRVESISQNHADVRAARSADAVPLERGQPRLNVFGCDLGQPSMAEMRDNVAAHRILVAAICQGSDSRSGDVHEPARHVLPERLALVFNQGSFLRRSNDCAHTPLPAEKEKWPLPRFPVGRRICSAFGITQSEPSPPPVPSFAQQSNCRVALRMG